MEFRPVRRWVTRSLVPCLASCLALGPVPPLRAAQDAAAAAEDRALAAMDAGDTEGASAAIVQGDAAAVLFARPDAVRRILLRAYRADARLAEADPDGRRFLVQRLGALADRAHEAAPTDDSAAWALALSLALRERVAPSGGTAPWDRAATLLADVHARVPGSGDALSYAVTCLLEGACRMQPPGGPLFDRAGELAAAAVRTHPESEPLVRSLGAVYGWASRDLQVRHRVVAREALRTGLDLLRPHAADERAAIETATIYNELVTQGRDARFEFPDGYATVPWIASDGGVEFDLPRSLRWQGRRVPATERTAAYSYVTQKDAAGRRLRQILFRRYLWSSDYTFEERRTVPGSEVERLARALQEMTARRTFASGSRSREPVKARLTRALTGVRFEVAGTSLDEEPQPLRVHGWALEGEHQATLVVLVYVYGDVEGLGAEMESLLASLRELPE